MKEFGVYLVVVRALCNKIPMHNEVANGDPESRINIHLRNDDLLLDVTKDFGSLFAVPIYFHRVIRASSKLKSMFKLVELCIKSRMSWKPDLSFTLTHDYAVQLYSGSPPRVLTSTDPDSCNRGCRRYNHDFFPGYSQSVLCKHSMALLVVSASQYCSSKIA